VDGLTGSISVPIDFDFCTPNGCVKKNTIEIDITKEVREENFIVVSFQNLFNMNYYRPEKVIKSTFLELHFFRF